MAKDIITRFKLETTAFDSAIKQASKELSDYSKTATKAKEGFNQFTKSNVDAAKALGTMATSSTNAKQKTQELVGAFNEAAKAYNNLTKEQQQSDFGKAMAQSLTTLQQRIRETKQELQGMGDTMKSSGLFGGGKLDGMLQVFGGNLMTKGFDLATSAVTNLVGEVSSCITQGIELARQGEGVRIAFERLGRGDILDGLREATHGTVTDIELMKAAVKFNDFKLPVEELGTMLAFAQQKAKDTGQSVDYMVDSIVTGLGRKSLMILDNLGLSAAEIKEKMKQTGDMTKAVGAIIREQMAKAGDYVETAADRAAQANVNLQNKMEELGRKFAPVEEASNQLWTSMKIGILDIIGGPLARLINGLTEAGRLKNALNDINAGNGGETKVEKALRILREYSGGGKGIEGKKDLYNRQMELYSANETKDWRNYNRLVKAEASYRNRMYERGQNAGDQAVLDNFAKQIENARNRALAWQQMAAQYEQGAKGILNPTASSMITPTNTDPKKTKAEQTELQQNQKKINDLTQEYVKLGDNATEAARKRQEEIQKEIKLLEDRNGLLNLRAEQAQGRLLLKDEDINREGIRRTKNNDLGLADGFDPSKPTQLSDKALKAVQKSIEKQTNLQVKELKDQEKQKTTVAGGLGDLAGGMNSVVGGLEQLGIEIPSGLKDVIGGMQAISSILTGIAATVIAIEAIAGADAIIPFARGGIVPAFANGGLIGKAAGGMLIPGNSFSGDNLRMPVDGGRGWIGVNSGELILSKSQQNNLANALTGGGMNNIRLEAVVSGEQLLLVQNNRGLRTGRGELVQSNRRR